MLTHKIVATVSLMTLGLALVTPGSGATFALSNSIPLPLYVRALNQTQPFPNITGTILGTATVDPQSQTCREIGSLFLPDVSFTFRGSHPVLQPFPLPPEEVSGEFTAHLIFDPQGTPFDNWARYSPGTGSFSIDAALTLRPSVTCQYSLTSGGQTYTGTWQTYITIDLVLGSTVFIENYPDNITILPDPELSAAAIPNNLGSLTAPNGFTAQLQVISYLLILIQWRPS